MYSWVVFNAALFIISQSLVVNMNFLTSIQTATLVLIVLLAKVSNSSQTQQCPRQCRCDPFRNTVYCMDKGLINLPMGIPTTTRRLYLQNNELVNSHDLDYILGTLTSLEKLELTNNSLTAFPKTLPPSIEWISMKRNNIRYIGRDAILYLKKLAELYLDHNAITNRGLLSSALVGGETLHTLSLQENKLTSVPSGLPKTIRSLHLNRNRISSVPRNSLEPLKNIVNLDLHHNSITTSSIEENAFSALTTLRYLDLSNNDLERVPSGLPESLTELFLHHNNIELINSLPYEKVSRLSMNLPLLRHLDLSHNLLKRVQPESLDNFYNLKTVVLHNNPWQCDCDLRYLKRWLKRTNAFLTTESNTTCNTPLDIQGVPLRSLDEESLKCLTIVMPKINTIPYANSIAVSWSLSDGSNPLYTKYSVLYGKCENCTQRDINRDINRKEHFSSRASAYELYPLDSSMVEGDVATINISDIESATSYLICLIKSTQDIAKVTVDNCSIIPTKEVQSITMKNTIEGNSIPVWIICIVSLVVVSLLIVIAVILYWRRSLLKQQRWKQGSKASSQMIYDPFRQVYTMGDVQADQSGDCSYVGGVNIANYKRGHISATTDAGREFEVTIVLNSDQNYLQSKSMPVLCDSSCSECREDTMSTSHTISPSITDSMQSQVDERLAGHQRHLQPIVNNGCVVVNNTARENNNINQVLNYSSPIHTSLWTPIQLYTFEASLCN